MAYKTAAKNVHFRSQEGSSSVRVTQRGYGGLGTFGDPIEILPSVKDQYEAFKRRAHEIDRKLSPNTPAVEREKLRAELAECLRNIGNMRRLLQEGSRLAFEAIFVQVANHRLPKDRFLTITEEAREIWRSKGYADFVPPPTQGQRRKTAKNALRLSKVGG
jgi:hypothetical protein